VHSVSVGLLTNQATVSYEASGPTGPRDIMDAIEDAGFGANLAPDSFLDMAGGLLGSCVVAAVQSKWTVACRTTPSAG